MYFRARGACARLFFPAPYFFVFCSPNCWSSSLVFLWIALETVSRLIESEKRRPLSLQKTNKQTNKQTNLCLVHQATFSSCQICKANKSLTVKRGRYDNLFWWMSQFFFSCLIQKDMLFGSGSTFLHTSSEWIIWGSTRYMPYRNQCRGKLDTSLPRS